MSIIFVLIPIALIFVAIAIGVFIWAVRSEQFDDLDRQASNILFDEDKTLSSSSSTEDKPASSIKPKDE